MKKRYYIKSNAFILLLIYLVSISPANLFHHHKANVSKLPNTVSCHKVVNYLVHSLNCTHNVHFSKAIEKCTFCDNHTVSPHSTHIFIISILHKDIKFLHSNLLDKYFFVSPADFSNRGPPSVSSFTV